MKIKICFLIQVLILISPLAQAEISYQQDPICKKELAEKKQFFEKTRAALTKKAQSFKKGSPDWNAFVGSEQYDWLRHATLNGLPKFANPRHREKCAVIYEAFAVETRPAAAQGKLESWKNCLSTTYKDVLPEMALELLECHGVRADSQAPSELEQKESEEESRKPNAVDMPASPEITDEELEEADERF